MQGHFIFASHLLIICIFVIFWNEETKVPRQLLMIWQLYAGQDFETLFLFSRPDSADKYLTQAKELKHKADTLVSNDSILFYSGSSLGFNNYQLSKCMILQFVSLSHHIKDIERGCTPSLKSGLNSNILRSRVKIILNYSDRHIIIIIIILSLPYLVSLWWIMYMSHVKTQVC